jgi:exodeoxyribonuclease VII large subunit
MSLFELNSLIHSAIDNALTDVYWIVAEIAECKTNVKGHCYLDLVEKEDNKTIAQIRATIWSYEYRTLSRKFEAAAKTSLKQGIKVLLLAAVNYHEVYGLSLNIKDIDPAYTVGEMALRKREIIDRLRREGIIDLNKEIALPLVPQRIAVISSPTAAGYGDFIEHLQSNPYGYKFYHTIFPALMQGDDAEKSVIAALDNIDKIKENFDLAVIIRGGGSIADLSCFDNYAIAARIAKFKLPVITGIGHEKDDTVADMVAHTKMKTPTAVAEFLISGLRGFEERIAGLENSICTYADKLLSEAGHLLNSLAQRLSALSARVTAGPLNYLSGLEQKLRLHLRQYMTHKENRLASIEQAVRHLDPVNVLRRGYSITRLNGQAIKDTLQVEDGDIIEIELFKGRVRSKVQKGGSS